MIKKILILTIFIFSNIYSAEVEITADKFEAFEKKGFSKFEGNVNIKKNSDKISANVVNIYFTKNKEALKYHAIDNVSFTIFHEKSKYNGQSEEIIYKPKEKEYILMGNANIEEEITKKRVIGEKIIFNEKTGNIQVLSSKKNKPVKFIFEIKDK